MELLNERPADFKKNSGSNSRSSPDGLPIS